MPHQKKGKQILVPKVESRWGHHAVGSITVEQHCSSGLGDQRLKPARPLRIQQPTCSSADEELKPFCFKGKCATEALLTDSNVQWFHLRQSLVQVLQTEAKRSYICFSLTLQVLPEWSGSARGATHLTVKLYTHDTFTALGKKKLVCTILFHLKTMEIQPQNFPCSRCKTPTVKKLLVWYTGVWVFFIQEWVYHYLTA